MGLTISVASRSHFPSPNNVPSHSALHSAQPHQELCHNPVPPWIYPWAPVWGPTFQGEPPGLQHLSLPAPWVTEPSRVLVADGDESFLFIWLLLIASPRSQTWGISTGRGRGPHTVPSNHTTGATHTPTYKSPCPKAPIFLKSNKRKIGLRATGMRTSLSKKSSSSPNVRKSPQDTSCSFLRAAT